MSMKTDESAKIHTRLRALVMAMDAMKRTWPWLPDREPKASPGSLGIRHVFDENNPNRTCLLSISNLDPLGHERLILEAIARHVDLTSVLRATFRSITEEIEILRAEAIRSINELGKE